MNIVVISFNLDISLSSFCVFDPLHFSHLFYVFEKQTLIGISWTGPSHSSVVLNCIKNHFQLNALFFFCFFFGMVESWRILEKRKVSLWVGGRHRKSVLLVRTSTTGDSSSYRPQNLVHTTKRSSQHVLQGVPHVWWRVSPQPHVSNSHTLWRRKWDWPGSDWACPGDRLAKCCGIFMAEERCVGAG